MQFKVDENLPIEVAEMLNTEPMVGMLWIVDEAALRIRGEK